MDRDILNNFWVMPCDQKVCDPIQKELYNPLWKAMQQAVTACDAKIKFAKTTRPTTERDDDDEDDDEPDHLVRFKTRPQTEAERQITALLGVPRGSPAVPPAAP